jgi:hypothetical protein
MIGYSRVKRVILATDDPTERKIRFMALLTSSLPKGRWRPVLVGGSAVEIYLDGMLRTGDMDIVYNRRALGGVLKAWKFSIGGGLRAWANEELGLAVDMVSEDYAGSYERVTTITTQYGPATISGIEDLIVKRLASAKFWNVPTDVEQAFLLAEAHYDSIDWNHIEQEARKADIGDYLINLEGMLMKRRKPAQPITAGRAVDKDEYRRVKADLEELKRRSRPRE